VHDEDSATQRAHRIAREATEREFRAEQVEYERCKVAESKQMFAEAEVFQLKQRNLAKRKSAAARSFIEAVEMTFPLFFVFQQVGFMLPVFPAVVE
jgi:hypothetical protein